MVEMAYTLESDKAGLNPKSTPLLAVQPWAGSLTSLSLGGAGGKGCQHQLPMVITIRTVAGASGQRPASSPQMRASLTCRRHLHFNLNSGSVSHFSG